MGKLLYQIEVTLRMLHRDLGVIEHPFRIALFEIGTRTTILRGHDGRVAVLSPGPLSAEDVEAIRALGPVWAVVAPNLMHHLFVGDALAKFPGAILLAPDGLAEKRPDLAIAGAPTRLDDASIRVVPVGGMPRLAEHVLVHRPSGTVVLTDLAFNVRSAPTLTRAFLRLNDGWNRFGPTRIVRSVIADRAAVNAAVRAVLEEDVDRVVLAHGEVLATGARAALTAAFLPS